MTRAVGGLAQLICMVPPAMCRNSPGAFTKGSPAGVRRAALASISARSSSRVTSRDRSLFSKSRISCNTPLLRAPAGRMVRGTHSPSPLSPPPLMTAKVEGFTPGSVAARNASAAPWPMALLACRAFGLSR